MAFVETKTSGKVLKLNDDFSAFSGILTVTYSTFRYLATFYFHFALFNALILKHQKADSFYGYLAKD
jgi:hypothetical protein